MISVNRMQNHYIPQILMTLSVIKLTSWLWKMLIQHASSLRVNAKYNNTLIYDKNQTAAGSLTKSGNTLHGTRVWAYKFPHNTSVWNKSDQLKCSFRRLLWCIPSLPQGLTKEWVLLYVQAPSCKINKSAHHHFTCFFYFHFPYLPIARNLTAGYSLLLPSLQYFNDFSSQS